MDPSRFWVDPQRWIDDTADGVRFEGHPQVHTMRYEDLILHTQEALSALCTFLGIPYSPDIFRYPDCATVRKYSSWFSEAKPLHDESIGRYRKPEFTDRIASFIAMPGCADLLRHFGYSSIS
jgi:hypothetical protein